MLVAGAALLLPLATAAGPAMTPLPIECNEALGSGGTSWYHDSAGGGYIGDAFPYCASATFWNGSRNTDDEGPFTSSEDAEISSDGTTVTTRIAIGLGFPPTGFAALGIQMDAEAKFHAPSAPRPEISRVPAKLLFGVVRDGAPLGGFMSARVRGPGVDEWLDLDALPDGVHEVDALLHPGATYEVGVYSSGMLEVAGSGSQRVTSSVLVPEPAGALLAMTGAAALAAARLGRRR